MHASIMELEQHLTIFFIYKNTRHALISSSAHVARMHLVEMFTRIEDVTLTNFNDAIVQGKEELA